MMTGNEGAVICGKKLARRTQEISKEERMDEIRKNQITFTRGLRVEDLTFHYPGGEDILKDVYPGRAFSCDYWILRRGKNNLFGFGVGNIDSTIGAYLV